MKKAARRVAEGAGQPERWPGVESRPPAIVGDPSLVERQIDVRTMMIIGGWAADEAIEPSLAAPTEARIGDTTV